MDREPDGLLWGQIVGSVTSTIYGAGLLWRPGAYRAGVYGPARETMPLQWWGAAFVTVGLVMLSMLLAPATPGLRRRRPQHWAMGSAVFAQVSLMVGWSLLLFVAAATPRYEAGTLFGPLPWLGLALSYVANTWRHGVHVRREGFEGP